MLRLEWLHFGGRSQHRSLARNATAYYLLAVPVLNVILDDLRLGDLSLREKYFRDWTLGCGVVDRELLWLCLCSRHNLFRSFVGLLRVGAQFLVVSPLILFEHLFQM